MRLPATTAASTLPTAHRHRSGVSILGNVIYQSNIIGIALSDDGVTANNTAGPGPNDYQNYPVLSSAVTDGASSITIDGSLEGVAFAELST